ncbi:MAG: T9SS type A sorting domain-containing protein [Bacteroidales bacterium]|nr:T9SS type A sorting domain-containing protein [Bacteroidales bacterium]
MADENVTLTQDGDEWYVNMPANGTNTLTITAQDIAAGKSTFKVYDDGGKDGGYSVQCNGSLIINAPDGYIIQMKGNLHFYLTSHKLNIYNGNVVNNTAIIKTFKSSYRYTIDLLSSEKSVLFNLETTSGTEDGLDLTINILKPNDLLLTTITSVEKTYTSYGSIPTPIVTDLNNNVLSTNEYDVICTYNNQTVSTIDKSGVYTLIIQPSENSNYVGSKSVQFNVCVFSIGDGSNENPYQLSSVNDLKMFALIINDGVFSNANAILMSNIDFSSEPKDATIGNNYIPIGTEANPFTGHFDGNGKLISGINNENINAEIAYSDKKGSFQGIFGCIGTNGYVENLTIGNSTITGKRNVGGIAGYNLGTINNCHTLASTSIIGEIQNSYYHGGIIGYNEGTVNRCTSAATVTAGENYNCYDYGGIAGSNKGTLSNNLYYGTTLRSTFYSGNSGDHYLYCGAILGSKNGTLSNNYYTTDLTSITISFKTKQPKGCGNLSYSDVIIDIPENDGAMPIYKATTSSSDLNITAPDGGYVTYTLYDGTVLTYYKSGTTLTVSNAEGKLYDQEMLPQDMTLGEIGLTFPWGDKIGGYCGYAYRFTNDHSQNLYYTITDEDNDNILETLTVNVTPYMAENVTKQMKDYSITMAYLAPWYTKYASSITNFVVGEGVTSVGLQSFGWNISNNNYTLKTITLPSTISTFNEVMSGLYAVEKVIAPVSVFAKYASQVLLFEIGYNNQEGYIFPHFETPVTDVVGGNYQISGYFHKDETITTSGLSGYFFTATMTINVNSDYLFKSKSVKIGGQEVDFELTENDDKSVYTGTFDIKGVSELMDVEVILCKKLSSSDITVCSIPDQTYTGDEIKPSVIVKDGETDITSECEIIFSDNINVGTATVTIIGKEKSNGYTGKITREFTINPAPITATDDISINSNVKIWSFENTIFVENASKEIVIVDMAGRIVKSVKPENSRIEIQLSNSGVYIVKTGLKTQKIIIQ